MQEDGYDSLGVVTPHASFLALPYAAPEALVRPLLGKERFST